MNLCSGKVEKYFIIFEKHEIYKMSFFLIIISYHEFHQ